MYAVRILTVVLALAGGAFAQELLLSWKYIDIKHVIKGLRDVPQAGFEPLNYDGSGGDVPIYLCSKWEGGNDGEFLFGKLLYRKEGDLVCYGQDNKIETSFQYNIMNYKKMWVLATPPECYSWIPFDASLGFPLNWPMKARTRFVDKTQVDEERICRVFNYTAGYLIPGNMGSDTCSYPYHGIQSSKENVEILAWSQYAYANIDYCNSKL